MSYVTSDRKSDLESQLASTLAQIAAINTALAGASLSGTKRYEFDAGTGKQMEIFNSPLEMINALSKLEAKLSFIRRALGGQTVMTQQLRR